MNPPLPSPGQRPAFSITALHRTTHSSNRSLPDLFSYLLRPFRKCFTPDGTARGRYGRYSVDGNTHSPDADHPAASLGEEPADIGVLLGRIAHDISNPLMTIKVFAELLPRKMDNLEFLEKFSRIVPGEVLRIEQEMRNLLRFKHQLAGFAPRQASCPQPSQGSDESC